MKAVSFQFSVFGFLFLTETRGRRRAGGVGVRPLGWSVPLLTPALSSQEEGGIFFKRQECHRFVGKLSIVGEVGS